MNSKVFTVHQLVTIYVHENKHKKTKVNTVNSFHQKKFFFLLRLRKMSALTNVYTYVYTLIFENLIYQ